MENTARVLNVTMEKANVIRFPKGIQVISCTNDTYEDMKEMKMELQQMELKDRARQYRKEIRAKKARREEILATIFGTVVVACMGLALFIL